ncbi:unnamed protein product [Gadus morhua 'NCC']
MHHSAVEHDVAEVWVPPNRFPVPENTEAISPTPQTLLPSQKRERSAAGTAGPQTDGPPPDTGLLSVEKDWPSYGTTIALETTAPGYNT